MTFHSTAESWERLMDFDGTVTAVKPLEHLTGFWQEPDLENLQVVWVYRLSATPTLIKVSMSALRQQGVGVPPSLLKDPCSAPPRGVRALHGRIQWMIFFVLNSCNFAPANPLINKLIKRTPRGFANCRNQQCFKDSQPRLS
ncbi:hypothetical protein AOLI_G00301780 [Acnodon oligacanthus]